MLPQLIWLGDNYFFQTMEEDTGESAILNGTNPKIFVDKGAVILGEMQCKAGIFDTDGN